MSENLHHDFGPWTVKQLQYSVAGFLKESQFRVDGVYGPETTALVRRFQVDQKIDGDGETGPETWGAIQRALFPRSYSSSTANIVDESFKAVQDALTFQGFPCNTTGKFDSQTIRALRQFQAARRDPTASGDGKLVTPTTFHLLVTGCQTPGKFWFDMGWPQGSYSVETFKCLKNSGMEFATIECYVEEGPHGQFFEKCIQNINNAFVAGFQNVGAYAFFQRYYPEGAEAQVQWLIGNLSAAGGLDKKVSNFMLDIEGGKWMNYTQKQNQQFLLDIKAGFNKLGFDNIVVYCGSEWLTYFGNEFDAFKHYPLVYAHYDDILSFVDFWPPYGGWDKPSGKQFWDGIDGEQICDTDLDWDWSLIPFWASNNSSTSSNMNY